MNKKVFMLYGMLIVLGLPLASVAQERPVSTFAQINAGYDPTGGFSIKPEYGVRWKFLQAGLSFNFYNTLPCATSRSEMRWPESADWVQTVPGGENNYYGSMSYSFMLNAGVDVLRIFLPHINHSIYVGAGIGVTQFNRMEFYGSEKNDKLKMTQHLVFGFDYSLKGGYAYTFKNKLSLGAYFEYQNIPEMGVFGISVGREF